MGYTIKKPGRRAVLNVSAYELAWYLALVVGLQGLVTSIILMPIIIIGYSAPGQEGFRPNLIVVAAAGIAAVLLLVIYRVETPPVPADMIRSSEVAGWSTETKRAMARAVEAAECLRGYGRGANDVGVEDIDAALWEIGVSARNLGGHQAAITAVEYGPETLEALKLFLSYRAELYELIDAMELAASNLQRAC